MNVPAELQYSEDHLWVLLNKDGHAKIGLTDLALEELGEVVFVELPKAGEMVGRGESFGSIESVKTVTELAAPVSGRVVEVNEALLDNPDRMNEDPYKQGWLIVMEASDEAELKQLWSADRYKQAYADDV